MFFGKETMIATRAEARLRGDGERRVLESVKRGSWRLLEDNSQSASALLER